MSRSTSNYRANLLRQVREERKQGEERLAGILKLQAAAVEQRGKEEEYVRLIQRRVRRFFLRRRRERNELVRWSPRPR